MAVQRCGMSAAGYMDWDIAFASRVDSSTISYAGVLLAFGYAKERIKSV